MVGMRCVDCGEVRWSILPRKGERREQCPACGAQMVAERRQPGRRAARRPVERRDAAPRLKLG